MLFKRLLEHLLPPFSANAQRDSLGAVKMSCKLAFVLLASLAVMLMLVDFSSAEESSAVAQGGDFVRSLQKREALFKRIR